MPTRRTASLLIITEPEQSTLSATSDPHATKAAVEEGVVAGGGAALLYATRVLENNER